MIVQSGDEVRLKIVGTRIDVKDIVSTVVIELSVWKKSKVFGMIINVKEIILFRKNVIFFCSFTQ